jgi:hypothetical protein
MTVPVITVLIDTYNHERFIEEAIVSVLEQDFPPGKTEILVVDDGSTDRTPELVQKFAPRVRLIRKVNGGQASAFNAGIPEARGEIVAFLDGDDWWAKNKLTLVMEAFDHNPKAGAVGHGIIQVDQISGRSSALCPKEVGYFDLNTSRGAKTFRHYMPFLGTSRVAIRKNILATVLPIPEALVVEADEFISTMSAAHSGAVLLEQPLTYYRLHGQNLFMIRNGDTVRQRTKMEVMECLAKELSAPLQSAGIPQASIAIVLEPIRVFVSRTRLALDGGSRSEAYRVERANFRFAYSRTSFAYRVFKELSFLPALLLPPRIYYKICMWYADHNVRRFRTWLGEPTPAAPIHEERL